MKQKSFSRILAFILAFVIVFSSLPTGSFATEVTSISSADDLRSIIPSGNYELTCDIDLGGVSWAPLEQFTGTLDGKGHTIRGINIDQGVRDGDFGTYYGLFATTSGVIKNLGLEGSITVNPAHPYIKAGLLAGKADNDLSARQSIENCYALVTLTNELPDKKWQVGGISGRIQSGNISNCFGVSTTSPTIGSTASWNYTVSNCYYDKTVYAGVQTPSTDLTAKTTEEMHSETFAALLTENSGTGNNQWSASEGGYPIFMAGAVAEKPISATVQVWGPDGILMPKTPIDIINFDLSEFGATTPTEPRVIQALIAAMRANGATLPDANLLSFTGGIRKLYNISGSWLHSANGEVPVDNIWQSPLAPSDDIVLFFGDWGTTYSWFGADQEVAINEPVTVNLKGYKTSDELHTPVPIEGATILIDNVPTDFVTDTSGNAVLSFATPGEHTISVAKTGVAKSYCKILAIDRGNTDEKLAAYKLFTDNLAAMPEFINGTFDWSVIDMVAYGKRETLTNKAEFLEQAIATAKKSPTMRPSTDFERVSIALTAMGHDITKLNVGNGETLDLLSLIANFDSADSAPSLGTSNGYMYALLAYDSGEYVLPNGVFWTREKIVDYLIDTVQHNDGGWALNDSKTSPSDPDMTAYAISALAPYIGQAKVRTAVDKAVNWLSELYLKDGGFVAFGNKNSNSTAVAISALCALGIDVDNDSRFVFKGVSLIDHLMTFVTEDGRFGYTNNKYSAFSTEQGFRALVSYLGFAKNGAAYNVYSFGPPISVDDDITEIPVGNDDISQTLPEKGDVHIVTSPADSGGLKTVTLPQINVVKEQPNDDITLQITKGTKVTAPSSWNGNISMPKVVKPIVVGKSITSAIKVGSSVDLTFDKPVRLLIPDVSNGKVGYINANGELHEITSILATDTAEALSDNKDGIIKVGNNIIIWTKHFTTFVVYSDASDPIHDITVSVSVQGDAKRGVMMSPMSITVPERSTAWTAIQQALMAKKLPYENPTGNYVKSIDGLSEYTNGPNSGWYYYVNGVRPSIGLGEFEISNGDTIKMVYTDDYIDDYPELNGTLPENVVFSDLTHHSWAAKQIVDFASRGIVVGVGDKKFAPGQNVSRGDFIAILVKLFDLKAPFTDNFSDVNTGASYYSAVGVARALGVTRGIGGNLFDPTSTITRQDMFMLANNVLTVKKIPLLSTGVSDLSKYTDVSAVSEYSRNALGVFVQNGLVLGDNNMLNPLNSSTRAEAVVFLHRLDAVVNKK